MRNLLFLIIVTIVASCGGPSVSFVMTATINGENWSSNSVTSKLNDFNEVVEIKATGEDRSRLIFTMVESYIAADADDMPMDTLGVPLASSVSFSAKPSMHDINLQLDVFSPSASISEVKVIYSEIDEPVSILEGSELTGGAFNKVWAIENSRPSDNDFIFYQIEIVYENGQIWKSDLAAGVTSFRAKYDAGATQQETEGEFILTRLDRGKKIISGDFYFNTQDHLISSGRIFDYEY